MIPVDPVATAQKIEAHYTTVLHRLQEMERNARYCLECVRPHRLSEHVKQVLARLAQKFDALSSVPQITLTKLRERAECEFKPKCTQSISNRVEIDHEPNQAEDMALRRLR